MSGNNFRELFVPEDCPDGKEGNPQDQAALEGYKSCCVAEYVWLDGDGETRCKSKTVLKRPRSADDCGIWMFNGAATDQATVASSDVWLVPRKVFGCPVRGAPHVLVVCECITSAMEPAKGNYRALCAEVMEKFAKHDPWFGFEQEYTVLDESGYFLPVAGKNYYCGRGAYNLPEHMREIMGDHYAMCLDAGIKIAGMNVEGGRCQAEFQIGPCKGLDAGDHLIAARHTLHKAAQKYRCVICFDPKQVEEPEEQGGEVIDVSCGLHINFSTTTTRGDKGLEFIEKCCRAAGRKQQEAMAAYGKGNELRLVGKPEVSDGGKFTFGVADRNASVRIPRHVGITGKGYLEDRRPGGNADPYRATAHLMATTGEALNGMTGIRGS